VLQYRLLNSVNEFGDRDQVIKPYMIDLESANGTMVNKEKIPDSRYYELKVGDVFSFGFSSREYVLMAEE
jgi:smad nuclear-interacting protein 1